MYEDNFYAVSNPDEMIPTSREELEWKGVWDLYVKYYGVDPNVDYEKVLYIHKDNAIRIGLL